MRLAVCSNITPESAGWRYIGFQVHRLAPKQVVRGGTSRRETCLVVLAGSADVVIDGESFLDIGHRNSVFDDAAPGAVYAPAGRSYSVTARERLNWRCARRRASRDARRAQLAPPK